MGVQVGASDCFLFFAVFYSSANVLGEWDEYSSCQYPIQLWLLVSYVSVLLFRASHYVGAYYSDADDDYLMHRQQGVPLWLNCAILGILFPFFISWTVVGTVWYYDIADNTPTCFPDDTPSWFILFWLGICYLWIVIYTGCLAMAISFELRARRMDRDLQSLQSEDMLRRWGNIQYASGLGIHIVKKGLSAAQISNLPTYLLQQPLNQGPCSICLDELRVGDTIRVLQHCGHLFHHSCIDIWLLRNAICPLCKSGIPISQIARTGPQPAILLPGQKPNTSNQIDNTPSRHQSFSTVDDHADDHNDQHALLDTQLHCNSMLHTRIRDTPTQLDGYDDDYTGTHDTPLILPFEDPNSQSHAQHNFEASML